LKHAGFDSPRPQETHRHDNGVAGRSNQRLEFLYRRKLAALDELKKSLLHRAFSGKL
jgi:hypothetical protein